MTGPLARWFKMPTLTERLRAQGVRDDLIRAADRTAFGRQTDSVLPAVHLLLADDEHVVTVVEGRMAGAIGLLVLTSRRLLFVPKQSDRSTVTEVRLSEVTAAVSGRRRGLGVLDISTTAGRVEVDQILGTQAQTLAESVEQARHRPPHDPAAHRDPLEQLAELRALHRAGVIGDVEFGLRKQEFFGQI